MVIIAVDDKKLPLAALESAIREADPDAELYGFSSGKKALLFATENEVDVAFIDINMPEIDGITLAKMLKIKHPEINIIFATGYSEFANEAFLLHSSGYLMKPITAEKVKKELSDLRHPVSVKKNRVRIQTFGNFGVFIDDKQVVFQHEKTKEYLAYLVDRGTLCTNNEIAAAIWEEEVSPSYIRLVRKDLIDTFREAGCEEVLIHARNRQGIRPDLVDCDYFDWKRGLPSGLNAYRGEYMSQYSWAEDTHAELEWRTVHEGGAGT